jgi:hypothetical protein
MRLLFETHLGIWPEVKLWLFTPYFLSLKYFQLAKFELGGVGMISYSSNDVLALRETDP